MRPALTAAESRLLQRVRRVCLAIDGVVEKPSHGEPTWFTGPRGRTFASFDSHHHGAAHVAVVLAAPVEVQQALVASDPTRYAVPPYVGHRGWVSVVLDLDPDWPLVERLLRAAHGHVLKPSGSARRIARTAAPTASRAATSRRRAGR